MLPLSKNNKISKRKGSEKSTHSQYDWQLYFLTFYLGSSFVNAFCFKVCFPVIVLKFSFFKKTCSRFCTRDLILILVLMAVKTDLMPNHQKKLKKKRLQSLPHKVASNNSEKLSDNATISTKSNNNLKLVAQELKFAKLLAGNDPKISQKQLIKLQKWLKIRSQSSYRKYFFFFLTLLNSKILIPSLPKNFPSAFDDQDFLRIWKGLFYGMWMCDKPLPQEKMADDLAALIHCFNDPALSIQFFGTFLQTINKEWFGIDQWRIDKFMMVHMSMSMFKLFVIIIILHTARSTCYSSIACGTTRSWNSSRILPTIWKMS